MQKETLSGNDYIKGKGGIVRGKKEIDKKITNDHYDKLLTPYRLEGESYEEFKIRERTMKKLLKKYLRKQK